MTVASDTIFAHSSGRPPAAIAVIRISGDRAHAAGEALAGPLPPARQTSLRKLRGSGGAILDEALLLRFDAPASATGEHLVELHCHGGRAVVAAVLAALSGMEGLRAAMPGEFTRRALENGRIDLTEAEGLADLLEAETEAQRRLALTAVEGGVRRLIDGWRKEVIDLSAQVEAAIDYVGDEEETSLDRQALESSIGRLRREWGNWLSQPRSDKLRRGARVVLAGPPNTGKSSLLNAMIGEDRAIVTSVAGTTRDTVEVPLSIDGIPIVLIDTAGLRVTGDQVERLGVVRAQDELARADLLLWLGDPEEAPEHPNCLRIHSQSDRREEAPEGSLAVSSFTGQNIPTLKRAVHAKVASLFPKEDGIALSERQARLVDEARIALEPLGEDLLITAEQLRQARDTLDRVVGVNGTEEMLDALFGRFCLGK